MTMRRIRLLFLALAVALLVSMALLLHRAARSVDLEGQVRQRTVAERIFDEMERALSDFVAREPGSDPAFVIARFTVDADGRVTSVPSLDAATANAIDRAIGGQRESDALNERRDAASQIPGTTVGLADEAKKPAAPPQAASEVSAYDALRALNKGALQRQKLKEEVLPQRAEPMSGRVVEADRLILTRTILRGGAVRREGIVVDVRRLGDWLRDQAFGGDGLAARAQLSFSTPLAPGATPAGDFVYQHRFADPFADLTARLALATLPGLGGASWVYGLSVALALTALLGLLALYRMVSVAVAFAERRSNFVAAVSHELKTPLTAIRMYGEMLRDGIVASDAKRAEYYRHITAESERLSRLINNVLEFARLEKGTREVALVTAPVLPVVREATELVRPHLEAEGFVLEIDSDGDLPAVRFERDALLQVLFNLIDNAVKYTGDGAKRIVLRLARDGDTVRIVVRDHGPGVPAQHLAHVFEPFYRGEHELTRRSKGTGIGLALVRGLVERMGGRVRGRNGPDGGFEVTIALAGAPS
jgi:two-component system, OmpR family, sensor histidine kinase VicK